MRRVIVTGGKLARHSRKEARLGRRRSPKGPQGVVPDDLAGRATSGGPRGGLRQVAFCRNRRRAGGEKFPAMMVQDGHHQEMDLQHHQD